MKKKLLLFFFIFAMVSVHAQLNNNWIDYSKTYYKFKVGKDSLCRINQPVLAAAGIGSIPAEQFQLWRNGQQVRIYTSSSTGLLGPSGFIEFWGLMNDGVPDKPLYTNTDNQLNDKISFFTDTSTYYLTVNPAGGNLRFTNAPNNPPGAMAPDNYLMRTVEAPQKFEINRGYASVVGEYVYLSDYDEGEGYSSYDIFPCCALYYTFYGMNVYTAGPPNSVTLQVNASGNALNVRNMQAKFLNILEMDSTLAYFAGHRFIRNNIPLTDLQNPDLLTVSVGTSSSNSNDRIVVQDILVTYPAKFIFNNQKSFRFELQNSAAGNYLVIDNFNYGTAAPVLFDNNTGNRYIGDIISTPGKVKFVLPPSADPIRRFQLANQEINNIFSVSNLTAKTFINYSSIANQGDYLIISKPVLYNNGSGINYVDQYRQYRSSSVGGGYNAKVVSIDELDEQFAFGIKKHPDAIRHFIQFANQVFVVKPKYIFLIGRGTAYNEYRVNDTNAVADKLNLVQTFGWPASDVMLASLPGSIVPKTPIGRLAAIEGNEVGAYLDKVKQYDLAQQSPLQTVGDKAWMKNFLHVSGGADSTESAEFESYLNQYRDTAMGIYYGGHVETFKKTSVGAVQQANNQRIQDLFHEGLSYIQYFGHSSASTLEFNLSEPELYQNQGKYPMFGVSGCTAGNIFTFSPQRLNGEKTLSEKYVLFPQRGSISFIASTHFGLPPYLHSYNIEFYSRFCDLMYGNTVGNQLMDNIHYYDSIPYQAGYYKRMHLQQITLHGDPALRINYFTKPDYVVEDPMVRISPNIITVADNSFNIDIKMMNIGKAIIDSIRVTVKQKLPNDSIRVLYDHKILAIKYMDSLSLVSFINPITDKGLNHMIVTLDVDNKVDELSELNNTVTKDFYIFEDELRPIYPYNYAIVNQQNITYSGSTANPLSVNRQYIMEVDTSELFNSPFKKVYNQTGQGGLVQFTPSNITFTDSSVYYWRMTVVPLNNNNYIWNTSSFVYLANSSSGFNQSHYYQHLHSNGTNIGLDIDRIWRFKTLPVLMGVKNGVFPTAAANSEESSVTVNGDNSIQSICGVGNIVINVFNPLGFLPIPNDPSGGPGLFNSDPVCGPTRQWNFQYNIKNRPTRTDAMNFLNQIPNGYYVVVRNTAYAALGYDAFASEWAADTATLGSGISLYNVLKNAGFSTLDSFNRLRSFIFVYKKNDNSFTPSSIFSDGLYDKISLERICPAIYSGGVITSPVFGPAKKWNALHWRSSDLHLPPTDKVSVEVWGINSANVQVKLATVLNAQDTILTFINANTYRYLFLKMNNSDTLFGDPSQLRYWRINADYVPEGAVAPSVKFTMKDTLDQGETADFALAFKNISQVAFDSLIKVKLIITDRNNVPHVIPISKRKALPANDTLIVSYSFDTRNYAGSNTLFIEFNPDNDQPEQFHFNNILYKDFYVKGDIYNPLLDVTFDNVHILNRDIVASKPNILIKLKDESRYLALADTSLLKVQVRFPDQSIHNYIFGTDLRFTPANLATGQNTATIDFSPYFPLDGEYELIVSGKDVMGNKAGDVEYHVIFTVINKPMISNLLNYPNPFTTSTAFVFTVTGNQIPQNIRIQILTITGKVVREITKDELGPIHIGRNITDFKWDGSDMYGQKLANGVYLYRVLTNLNGKSLDKYKADGDNTDKYFTKGYGKMYLMR